MGSLVIGFYNGGTSSYGVWWDDGSVKIEKYIYLIKNNPYKDRLDNDDKYIERFKNI